MHGLLIALDKSSKLYVLQNYPLEKKYLPIMPFKESLKREGVGREKKGIYICSIWSKSGDTS